MPLWCIDGLVSSNQLALKYSTASVETLTCRSIEFFKTGRVITLGCPGGWKRSPDGSRCFGLMFDRKNWQDARRACKAYGADLASFHSRYDQLRTE